MQIETRRLGKKSADVLDGEVTRAFTSAVDRFGDRIGRVRIRLISDEHETTCRARVWCGHGPTVVIEERAASGGEAIHAAADALKQALRRRWSTRRSRRRSAATYYDYATITDSRKEMS